MPKVIKDERIPIKLWLDELDPNALRQARNLANLPFAYKWIAIMPDCHVGYGMPIGGVLATNGAVVPNAVGVDIGCGMIATKTSLRELKRAEVKEMSAGIRRVVPVGFKHQQQPRDWSGFDRAPDIPVIQRELSAARRQIGTLGGGNHFIEIQRGNDGHIWVMVHSGSRNFGLKIAREFHQIAVRETARGGVAVPCRDLSFLDAGGRAGRDYFAAMNFALDFAAASRALMLDAVLEGVASFGGSELQRVNIHHNYAAFERHYGRDVIVHRKGATKAAKGLLGIVPGSMGTPSYIVEGLGNPESFMSCSHGAGRVMGRRAAQRSLDLASEQARMGDIVHPLHTPRDLEEAPGAYKDIDQVMANQSDLARIVVKLNPLGVVKG